MFQFLLLPYRVPAPASIVVHKEFRITFVCQSCSSFKNYVTKNRRYLHNPQSPADIQLNHHNSCLRRMFHNLHCMLKIRILPTGDNHVSIFTHDVIRTKFPTTRGRRKRKLALFTRGLNHFTGEIFLLQIFEKQPKKSKI